jgi:hypothetical protein
MLNKRTSDIVCVCVCVRMDNRNEIEKFVVLWKMVTLVLAANAMQQRGENNSQYYDVTHTPRECNSHTPPVLSHFYLYLIYLYLLFVFSTRPKSNSALSSIHLGVKLDPRER